MKRFANLKIGSKLTLGFTVVAVIAAVIGLFGIINIRLSTARGAQMYSGNTKPVAALEQVAVYFQRTRVNMLRIIMSNNADDQKKYLDRLNSFQTTIDSGMKDYASAHTGDKQYADLENQLSSYIKVRQQVLDLATAGKQDEAYQYSIDHELDAATAVNNILDQMFSDNVTQAAALNDSNTKSADTVLIISFILVGAGIVFSVIIGVLTTRSIVRPVMKLMAAAESLAVGDVQITIKSETTCELGLLMDAFERMIDNIRSQARVAEQIADGDLTVNVPVRSDKDLLGLKLREMVANNNELLVNISSASQQVTMGAENIASSSSSLAQGATEQASAIEQLTSSVEEISDKTALNARKAVEAKQLADKVKSGADGGTGHVREMLDSMADIRASSESISKIISVIDNIAFQTNILALNAAVEAARAGEHGKGFAVVASEVKNLADKSAKAAKEVTDIILGSTDKVKHGQGVAQVTADSLMGIADDVTRVSALVSDIAEASESQATGLSQIKTAIQQVSIVISNNTAMTESNAAASQELSGQACLLLEMVEKYKLDETGGQRYLTA
jgi:methyl-accepting chemotaxis protein